MPPGDDVTADHASAALAEAIGARLDRLFPELELKAGSLPEAFADRDLAEIRDGLPDWWSANGNRIFGVPGEPVPHLAPHPGLPPPINARVLVGRGAVCPTILLWGEDPLVAVGQHVNLAGGQLACGNASTVVIGDRTACTFMPEVNCRNGGAIFVGADGLWASHVRLYSDDMHAIRDLQSNRRCNRFGGAIYVGRHVWLGLEALLMGGTRIGDDAVVGARGLVRGPLPANTVSVGVPAKPVRSGITWSFDDAP